MNTNVLFNLASSNLLNRHYNVVNKHWLDVIQEGIELNSRLFLQVFHKKKKKIRNLFILRNDNTSDINGFVCTKKNRDNFLHK